MKKLFERTAVVVVMITAVVVGYRVCRCLAVMGTCFAHATCDLWRDAKFIKGHFRTVTKAAVFPPQEQREGEVAGTTPNQLSRHTLIAIK